MNQRTAKLINRAAVAANVSPKGLKREWKRASYRTRTLMRKVMRAATNRGEGLL